jgi:hypothetical protein
MVCNRDIFTFTYFNHDTESPMRRSNLFYIFLPPYSSLFHYKLIAALLVKKFRPFMEREYSLCSWLHFLNILSLLRPNIQLVPTSSMRTTCLANLFPFLICSVGTNFQSRGRKPVDNELRLREAWKTGPLKLVHLQRRLSTKHNPNCANDRCPVPTFIMI